MGAWKIIKEEMTRGMRAGSFGYLAEVNCAAKLFVALREELEDWDGQCKAFNADEEVGKAIALGPTIKEMRDSGVMS